MIPLVPSSLFGRTLLVLALGLLVAQAASVLLNLFDRGGSVYRLAAYQIAARIAQTSRILNSLPPAQRPPVVEQIDGRHLRVVLSEGMIPVATGFTEHDPYERGFAESLRSQLGTAWPVRVEITPSRARRVPEAEGDATPFEVWLARYFYFLLPATFSLVAQIGLEDGTVAVFYAAVPQESLDRLETLVPRLLLLLAVCFALAGYLVRMTTRPLDRLARAADAFGEEPESEPLAATGPSEVRKVIDAFNRMQARVRRQLRERAQLLGAISHDLKTPITRLRLRSEMLHDATLRAKIQRDLDDMEAMVASTLDFFRTVGEESRRRPVDVASVVDSLCEDRRETGETVSVRGAPRAPYRADLQALRRCLDNLIGNAVRYGGCAEVEIDDSEQRLRIVVRDRGPGIPPEELERVFEPYYRLDGSRNRASGGTGLGLSIARNIARWHGGDIHLDNAPDGGLLAELRLPRC
ncbi:MAG TPA: ATP-binding protein [Burkholderiales bacterium]